MATNVTNVLIASGEEFAGITKARGIVNVGDGDGGDRLIR